MICRLLIASLLLGGTFAMPTKSDNNCYRFPFYSREDWSARPPTFVTPLDTPVSMVVIHHSVSPSCSIMTRCFSSMRAIQDLHQIQNGWADIGYNFAVGSDGAVYEGRGWEALGAHAAGVNSLSIGIVLIGTWINVAPNINQLETTQRLIAYGVAQGYISPDYRLVGHRQVGVTECPGEALQTVITTWPSFRA